MQVRAGNGKFMQGMKHVSKRVPRVRLELTTSAWLIASKY